MGRNAVCIVDDHPLVIEAIGRFLSDQDKFQIIPASTGQELQRFLESNKRSRQFDIQAIFVDIQLPDTTGIELIPRLRSNYEFPIIAISGSEREDCIINACIRGGASGFVRKSSDLTKFSSALRIVLDGGLYFPPEYINGSKRMPVGATTIPSPNLDDLSDKHRQIYGLVIQGKSNKIIGVETCLAEGTVKNKVSELLTLFRVKSRAQLIAKANQLGHTLGQRKLHDL
jgi:DNA-binding NarL/FixJ family response regulator